MHINQSTTTPEKDEFRPLNKRFQQGHSKSNGDGMFTILIAFVISLTLLQETLMLITDCIWI